MLEISLAIITVFISNKCPISALVVETAQMFEIAVVLGQRSLIVCTNSSWWSLWEMSPLWQKIVYGSCFFLWNKCSLLVSAYCVCSDDAIVAFTCYFKV